MDIRQEIANKRAARITKEGYGLSVTIPKKREFPLVPFFKEPFIICEVKRGSPSKGGFAKTLNAVDQAIHYEKSGVKHVSVLTEEDRFLGSLKDLMDIKRSCPTLSILRKDFLLDIEDVETSYLCGADAFLLIASLLDKESLIKMYKRGEELGMTPLVEVHDEDDVNKVRELKPVLTGINSRNLKNFTIDPLLPLKIRSYINWQTHVIYESGIKCIGDGIFARDCGFSGVLVGEWAVKDRTLASDLVKVFNCSRGIPSWERLFKRYSDKRPFIKVCGITNREDAQRSVELGADLLGFILAESPRKTTEDFIKSIKDIDVLKVGVVVLKDGEKLPLKIIDLVKDGYLDFIQFHGNESSNECESYGIPYFKALRIKDINSVSTIKEYSRVTLVDSFTEGLCGGTGKMISRDLTKEIRKGENLWLAGGLNPQNIKSIIEEFNPELVDVASGVESSPGKKDKDKLEEYFKELI